MVGTRVASGAAATMVRLGDEGFALFDGLDGEPGDRHPSVEWIRGGRRYRVLASDLPGMIYPSAWWGGGRLSVFGRECPDVDLAYLYNSDQATMGEICGRGGGRPVIRSFDPSSGAWSRAIPVEAGDDGNASLGAASGTGALVVTDRGLLVDVDDGTVTDLGPELLRGAQRVCPLPGGGFVVVSQVEPPVGEGGIQTTMPSDGPVVVPADLFLIREKEVARLEVPPGPPAPFEYASGCDPAGGVIGAVSPSADAVATLRVRADDTAIWARFHLPEGVAPARAVLHAEPPDVIAQTRRPGHSGLGSDGRVAWRRTADGGWVLLDGLPDRIDDSSAVLADDETILWLERFNGPPQCNESGRVRRAAEANCPSARVALVNR